RPVPNVESGNRKANSESDGRRTGFPSLNPRWIGDPSDKSIDNCRFNQRKLATRIEPLRPRRELKQYSRMTIVKQRAGKQIGKICGRQPEHSQREFFREPEAAAIRRDTQMAAAKPNRNASRPTRRCTVATVLDGEARLTQLHLI